MNQEIDPIKIIQKYYQKESELYRTLVIHSQQVQTKALEIAHQRPDLKLNIAFITTSAMLHDIGILRCHAPRIHCVGSHHYIEHGYLGAELLRAEGLSEYALVCERHTGVGISLETILLHQLPLPKRDMIPLSLEEKLICYADKFFSKTQLGSVHTIQKIRTDLAHLGHKQVLIFDEWHEFFEG
jgi:uncharacterized protein